MVRKILEMARLHLIATFGQRYVLISALIMPLLFTFVIGQAMADDSATAVLSLTVVNQDQGAASHVLIARLHAEPSLQVEMVEDAETAIAAVNNGTAVAALVIPEHFSTHMRDRESIQLSFYSQDAPEQAQRIQQELHTMTVEVVGSSEIAQRSVPLAAQLNLLDGPDSRTHDYYQEAFTAAEAQWQTPRPVRLVVEQAGDDSRGSHATPHGLTQSAPGMTVMFVMFFTVAGAVVFIQEREQGTLRRLLIMPMPRFTIVAGKLLGVFTAGMIQIAILIMVGMLAFDVNWGQSPGALLLVSISFVFAATSLGMLIAAVAQSYMQADALNTIIVMSLAALGGAWWPLAAVPEWMQTLAKLVPTSWAMGAFQAIITHGAGVEAILLEVGILLGFGVVFLTMGVSWFRTD